MRNPLVRLIGFLLASACFLCACAVQDPDPSSCISSKEDDVSSLLSTVSPSGGSSAEQTEPPSSQTPDDPSGPDTPASSETPPDPSSQAGVSSDRPSITKKPTVPTTTPPTSPPPYTGPIHIREPAASGTVVYAGGDATIDASHIEDGYVMVKYSGSASKIKVQIITPGRTYNYDLNTDGRYEVFPLQAGNGSYKVRVMRNITGSSYSELYSVTLDVSLSSSFSPFLYPNQYIAYSAASAAVKKSFDLCAGASGDLAKIEAVYTYVTGHIKYDTDKAKTVTSGYLPDVDDTLKSGISFGSLSCKAIAEGRPYLAATTTSPDEAVFTKPGTDTRYLHARFAIEERDIRDISSVFITGVLDLMRYIEDSWELLVRDIECGTIDPSIQMPADVRAALEARIKPNPERAAELRAIFERGFDEPITPVMWPNLLVIRSVAGGGFAPYTQRLRRFIGNDVHILYTGYSASEGAFSVPFELDNPASVLLPRSVYFEFVPVDDPDYGHTLGVEDLEEGHDYEVIITSRSGFYRYKMRDAIRCVGHKGTMPTMEFLFRLDQTVNMHGEKTTEMVLRKVADKVAERAGLDLVDFSVYPNVDHHPARYEYLFEFYHADHAAIDLTDLSRITDEELRAGNYDVDYMTEDGTFAPAVARVLQDETNQLWRDMRVMHGKAPNQIKPVHIIDTEQKRRFFFALIDGEIEG